MAPTTWLASMQWLYVIVKIRRLFTTSWTKIWTKCTGRPSTGSSFVCVAKCCSVNVLVFPVHYNGHIQVLFSRGKLFFQTPCTPLLPYKPYVRVSFRKQPCTVTQWHGCDHKCKKTRKGSMNLSIQKTAVTKVQPYQPSFYDLFKGASYNTFDSLPCISFT